MSTPQSKKHKLSPVVSTPLDKKIPRTSPRTIESLKRKSADTLKNMSITFIKGLKNYTRESPDYYSKINGELRSLAAAKKSRGRVCAFTRLLQSLFFNPHCPVTQKPTILYRGISNDFVSKKLHDMKIGDVFQEDGFMSTSILPKVAEGFRDRDGDRKCCILVITLPPNIPILHLEAITEEKGEDEILLPPGMGLVLTDHKVLVGKDVYYFDCSHCHLDSRYPLDPHMRELLNKGIRTCF
jgi:hypothetical protein